MYRKKNNKTGAVELHINHIPSLEEVFNLIEEDSLDLEGDEVISYYFDAEDREKEAVSTASYNQMMYLYSQCRE